MPYKTPEARREYWNRWRVKNAEKVREYSRKYLYGLSGERYLAMLEEQDGKCAACGGPFTGRGPCVDHCHRTGVVRGILCTVCNTQCGVLESPRRPACEAYLKKFAPSRPEEL